MIRVGEDADANCFLKWEMVVGRVNCSEVGVYVLKLEVDKVNEEPKFMALDLVCGIERLGVYALKLEDEDEKLCGEGGWGTGVRFGIKHFKCTLCKCGSCSICIRRSSSGVQRGKDYSAIE